LASKIYVETSVVVCASLGGMLGGKPVKHDRYDATYNFLQYAELDYSQGKKHFFTTPTVAREANRVMEKAVNGLLASRLPKLWKKGKREKMVNAEKFYILLTECTDHLDSWLSYLKVETFDSRKKEEIADALREQFRTMDIDFHKRCPMDLNQFVLSTLNKGLRSVSKAIWTGQRKEILEEYKPHHGRNDIEIMAEIICINPRGGNDVYIVSEDRHFYAKLSREMIETVYGPKCRRAYQMLEGKLIRKLMQDAA